MLFPLRRSAMISYSGNFTRCVVGCPGQAEPNPSCSVPTLLSSPVPLPATSHPSKEPDGSKLHKPRPNGKLLPSLHFPSPPILTASPAPAPHCWPREDGKDGEKKKTRTPGGCTWGSPLTVKVSQSSREFFQRMMVGMPGMPMGPGSPGGPIRPMAPGYP